MFFAIVLVLTGENLGAETKRTRGKGDDESQGGDSGGGKTGWGRQAGERPRRQGQV